MVAAAAAVAAAGKGRDVPVTKIFWEQITKLLFVQWSFKNIS